MSINEQYEQYEDKCRTMCGLCGDDEYKGVALMTGSSYGGQYACNLCVAYSHSMTNPWVCDRRKVVCAYCAKENDPQNPPRSVGTEANFKSCDECYEKIVKPFQEFMKMAIERAEKHREERAKEKAEEAEEAEETEMMCRRCEVIAVHRTQKICDLCEEGNC